MRETDSATSTNVVHILCFFFIASPEWKRSYRIVKVLVKSGGNVNQAKTTDGASPLFIASQNGNVDTDTAKVRINKVHVMDFNM